ncbi:MAG: hypothetical protein M1457_12955 [bacterium]|nr:hypothetical protein [bacterium]
MTPRAAIGFGVALAVWALDAAVPAAPVLLDARPDESVPTTCASIVPWIAADDAGSWLALWRLGVESDG